MTPPNDSSHASSPTPNTARIGWTLLVLALLVAVWLLRPRIETWLSSGEPEGNGPAVRGPAVVGAADLKSPAKSGTLPRKTDADKPEVEAADKSTIKSAAKSDKTTDGKTITGKATPGKSGVKFAGLKDIGSNVKLSPAGLRYTPGSEEGHRLKHVLRHDNDQPDRPGSHGVFDGDEDDLLAVIDEAYLLAKAGGTQVKRRDEDGRTVYEIDMQRRIGFLGGQNGKRQGNPAVRRVRLVLDGDRVITAFPF